jgi:O-antigen ligase
MIADNMYLTILAEAGLIGTIGFLIFIIRLLSKALKQLQLLKVDREKLKLLVPFSALIGLLVNMGAYDLFFWGGPYILFCLMCGFVEGLPIERRLD